MYKSNNYLFLQVKDKDLEEFMSTYSHFDQFSPLNGLLMRSLERYVHARVAHMDRTVVAMVMDYLYKVRYLSPRIMDAVAADFEKNGKTYEAHHLFYSLRVYGLLGYLPPNHAPFFTKVEEMLQEK